MTELWSAILVAVLGCGGTVWGAIYAARSSGRVGETANAVTFARDLMARIETLETDVKELQKGLDQEVRVRNAATGFIERLLSWANHQHVPRRPPPIPPLVAPYIDPHLAADPDNHA